MVAVSASDPPPPSSSPSAGRRLSAARQDWGLSVKEAADYLNLSADTITALEQDAYDRLPGATFVKGYLRAYAKLLKLDPNSIMAHSGIEPEAMRPIPVTKSSLKRARRYYAKSKKRGRLLTRLAFAIALLLGATWFALDRLPGQNMEKILQLLKLPASVNPPEEPTGFSFPQTDEQEGIAPGGLFDTE